MKGLKSNNIYLSLKVFLALWAILSFLIGCGGADIPYTLVDPPGNPGGNPGGQNPVGQPPSAQGCVINFNSEIILQTKGGPSIGELTSNPHPVDPIPIHFNGNQISLVADEVPAIDLALENAPAALRIEHKSGTVAQGTFDLSSGSVILSNLINVVTLLDKNTLAPLGMAPIEFPAHDLQTGSVNQAGRFGNIQASGIPFDTNTRHLKLVGGLRIPNNFPSADLQDAALVVSFEGTLESLPNSGNCSSTGVSGVDFKQVTQGPTGEVEVDLPNDTLSFDRIFVPQAGVDHPTVGDVHYFSSRTLRVKNTRSSPLSATVANVPGFSVSPSGNITIPAGASRDFEIVFGFSPVSDYSTTAVPPKRTVSATLSFGEASVTLAGEAKRAAPELAVVGTESNALSSVDLGITPALVLGNGASTQLDCRPLPGQRVPLLAQKISIENRGVRPLQIQKIHRPLDNQLQSPDPFCTNYGVEFLRMGLALQGNASCTTVIINGKSYLTDQCQVPMGAGKVDFKVVYLPMNASSIRNATGNTLASDTGVLKIESNDPDFDGSPGHASFQLNLIGAVSPDQSNVLKIKKDGSTSVISAGGNLRLNIPNTTDASITQKLVLLNHLDEPLQNVVISVEDVTRFQILDSPTPPPTMVPAMLSGNGVAEPGKAEFWVRFTKPGGATSGSFSTPLKVRFVPGSTGAENTFEVTLIGSINHHVITGAAELRIEMIAAYFDANLLQGTPVDSFDYRKPQYAATKPGPLRLFFSPVEGSENLRSVAVVNRVGLDPFNANLMNNVRVLSPEDRGNLLRVYSTRLTGYAGGVEDANHDGIPDCTEPSNLLGPYEMGRCSYFYYIFATKPGQEGFFNDETGELVVPDIKLRLLNPYHTSILDYFSNVITNTDLKASVTTLTIDSLMAGGNPLVPDPRLTNSDIAVPHNLVENNILGNPLFQCPANWLPWNNVTPAFGCFINPTPPHFLKGTAARLLPNGDYSIVVVMLTKFKAAGSPDYVPSFMANSRMWVAIQGRLHACLGNGDCVQ